MAPRRVFCLILICVALLAIAEAVAGPGPPPPCSYTYANPTRVSTAPVFSSCTAITLTNCLFNISMVTLTLSSPSLSFVSISSSGFGPTTFSFPASGLAVTILDSTFARGFTLTGASTISSCTFLFKGSTLSSGYGSSIQIQTWTQSSSLTFLQSTLMGSLSLKPTTIFSNSSALSIVSCAIGGTFAMSVTSFQLMFNSSLQIAGSAILDGQNSNYFFQATSTFLVQANSSFVFYKNNVSSDNESPVLLQGLTMLTMSSVVFSGNTLTQKRHCPCSCPTLFAINSVTSVDISSWISVTSNKMCQQVPQVQTSLTTISLILWSAYNWYSTSPPVRLQTGSLQSFCDKPVNYQEGATNPFQLASGYYQTCPSNISLGLKYLCFPSLSSNYTRGACVCKGGGGGPFCLPFNTIPDTLVPLDGTVHFATGTASPSASPSRTYSREVASVSWTTASLVSLQASKSTSTTFAASRSQSTYSKGRGVNPTLLSYSNVSSETSTLSRSQLTLSAARASRSLSTSNPPSTASKTTFSSPLLTQKLGKRGRTFSTSLSASDISGSPALSLTITRILFRRTESRSSTYSVPRTASRAESSQTSSYVCSPSFAMRETTSEDREMSAATSSMSISRATATRSSCADDAALLHLLPLFAPATVAAFGVGSEGNISMVLNKPQDISTLVNTSAAWSCRIVFGFSQPLPAAVSASLSTNSTTSSDSSSNPSAACSLVLKPTSSSPIVTAVLVVSKISLALLAEPNSYASIEMNASLILVACRSSLLVPVGSIYFLPSPPTNLEVATSTTTAAVATVSSSVQMVAGNSGSNDLQVLAIIGLMQCSGTSVRNAFGNYRTLSPTKLDDSFLGVVLGNVALLAGVAALQLLLLIALKLDVLPAVLARRLAAKDERMNVLRRTERSWKSAAADARFPGLTLGAGIALYHGTIFAAGQLAIGQLDRKGTSMSPATRAFGIVLLILLLLVPGVALYASRRLYREFYLFDASNYFSAMSRAKAILMKCFTPNGAFQPRDHVMMFGAVFAAHCHSSPLWSVMPYFSSWILTLASMMDTGSPDSCIAMFTAMVMLHGALVAVIIVFKPHRVFARMVIATLQLLVTIVILLLSAVAVRSPAALSQGAILLLGTMQAALTAASLASSLAAALLFRRIHREEERGAVTRSLLWRQGIKHTDLTREVAALVESLPKRDMFGVEVSPDEQDQELESMLLKPQGAGWGEDECPVNTDHVSEGHVTPLVQEDGGYLSLTSSSGTCDTDDGDDDPQPQAVTPISSEMLPLLREREKALRGRKKGAMRSRGMAMATVQNPLLELLADQEEEEEKVEELENVEQATGDASTADNSSFPPPPPPQEEDDI